VYPDVRQGNFTIITHATHVMMVAVYARISLPIVLNAKTDTFSIRVSAYLDAQQELMQTLILENVFLRCVQVIKYLILLV